VTHSETKKNKTTIIATFHNGISAVLGSCECIHANHFALLAIKIVVVCLFVCVVVMLQ